MNLPKRIQRKRTKGWKAPEGTVHCTRPGKYGNPYIVGKPIQSQIGFTSMIMKLGDEVTPEHWRNNLPLTKRQSQMLYRNLLQSRGTWVDLAPLLQAKYISCWCKEDDKDCHLVVILEEIERIAHE